MVHTLVFAHEGSLEVVRHALPHTDGLWVIPVHRPRLVVEAVVPGTRKRVHVRKRRRERWRERVHMRRRRERWREYT